MYAIRSYYELFVRCRLDHVQGLLQPSLDDLVFGPAGDSRQDQPAVLVLRVDLGRGHIELAAQFLLQALRNAALALQTVVSVEPELQSQHADVHIPGGGGGDRITSYNVCYTKLLRATVAAAITAALGRAEGGEVDFLTGLLHEPSLAGEADRITSYNVCYTKLLR